MSAPPARDESARPAQGLRTDRIARWPGSGGAGLVAMLELRRAVARPRLFAINTAIPLLLVAPIALGAAPPPHAAAVYAVLFALFATFGAAIPLLRDAERGWVARLARTGLGRRGHLIGRALAGAALDAVQLTPSMVLIAAAAGAWQRLPLLWLTASAALVFGNLLGIWVAALARSVAEGALFAAVSCLLLLHASGVFRTPAAGSIGAAIETLAPFRPLHNVLGAVTAHASPHAGTSPLAAGLAIASAALVLTAILAPRLAAELVHAGRSG